MYKSHNPIDIYIIDTQLKNQSTWNPQSRLAATGWRPLPPRLGGLAVRSQMKDRVAARINAKLFLAGVGRSGSGGSRGPTHPRGAKDKDKETYGNILKD